MLRFFVGLCFGVMLTICSLGFVGVGHGTYVPMVFTGALLALAPDFGPVPVIVLVPFLWAFYFQFIPKIHSRRARITSVAMLVSVHILSGVLLGFEDPAFLRILNERLPQLLAFGLFLVAAKAFLLYFAVRGTKV